MANKLEANEVLKLENTISTITALSNKLNFLLFALAKFPKKRCNNNPRIKGRTICSNNLEMIAVMENSPVLSMNRLNQRGVAIIPIRPEILALKIAVGKFPFAIATITTEDETVEGKTPRKKIAIHKFEVVPPSNNGMNKKVSKGNTRKVVS